MSKPLADQTIVAMKRLQVLYVEDSPSDAELCLRDLKKAGVEISVDVVATRDDFREKLRSHAYDIILSDYRLPNWSGMDALEMAQHLSKDTPFIIVSGALGEEAIVECMKRGVTDYVLKDRPARLPTAIRRALEDRSSRDERTRMEEELRLSEIRYRRLFESAKDGILILDAATGEIIDVNPFMVNLLGYSRPEFLGKRLWELGPFEDQRNSQKSFRILQENEYIRYDDLPLEMKSGKRVDVEFVSNAYWSSERKVIQCNIRDMTERNQAAEKLRLSEALFRLISENVTDLIAVVDLNGKRVYNSPSYKGIITNPDVLRGTVSFNEVHPDDRENIKAIFEETIRTGQGQRAEYRFLLEDNTTRLIESQGSLIRNQQGEPVNLVIVSRDITQRKSLEEQLRQSQKIEAIGQLAGGVAHDFNNLLTIISGYSELVADAVGSEGPVGEQVREIQKAAARAAALTRQLLAFSRRQIMTLEVLDLKIVISHLEKMLQRLIGENIELETVCIQDVGHVKADQGQIEQVLMNLVVNARDAIETGGNITIELSNQDVDAAEAQKHRGLNAGRHVLLAVRDTGCGMGAEVLAHMFEPFFTTKEKGKGTGLGLATVYGIVKQSGGYIAVESEIGKGSTFKVYLPLIEEPVVEPDATLRSTAYRSCTETILVVEDEEAVRSLVRRLLETSGYTVLEASRGAEALALCERHAGPIHLMLTDVVMPLMSGIELAEHLASRMPATKILYMSGYTNNAITRRGVADEDIEFLSKPFTPQQLENKVRAVLDAASEDQSRAA